MCRFLRGIRLTDTGLTGLHSIIVTGLHSISHVLYFLPARLFVILNFGQFYGNYGAQLSISECFFYLCPFEHAEKHPLYFGQNLKYSTSGIVILFLHSILGAALPHRPPALADAPDRTFGGRMKICCVQATLTG
jgi:hypothetical protein